MHWGHAVPSDDGVIEIRRIIAGAEEVKPEPPRPLMREMPPADRFPVDALGEVLGAAACAIHDRVQAPIAIGGQSVLAAATLAVQAHADVVLPIGPGQPKPISNFLITVASSGERKTECDKQALWPIRLREKALREAHNAALPAYQDDKAAWEKARDHAIKAGNGDRAKIRDALGAVGPGPTAPLEPMLTCEEPTIEGLHKLFGNGWPSLGLFAAEGGRFVGGHAMSDEAKLRTASSLSALWDGEPIKRVRAGDATVTLPGRRLALDLMLQPEVAEIWLGDRLLSGQGLWSRMLASSPDSAAGTRFRRDECPETDSILKRYGARLLDILETPLPLAPGNVNELTPRRLLLSPGARTEWSAFADHVERAISPNGALETVRGLANKLPEHASRLAAVLTLVANIDAGEIASAEMQAGIALAEHYVAEALRLFGASRINADLRLAQRLLDWLLSQWNEPNISLPDIYQRSLNAIGDKATATKLVGILEDHGSLERIPQGAVVAGQRRRDAWRIIRG
jgi:Protein of unknown function (DUF3987)